jgi:hypothetical protein
MLHLFNIFIWHFNAESFKSIAKITFIPSLPFYYNFVHDLSPLIYRETGNKSARRTDSGVER